MIIAQNICVAEEYKAKWRQLSFFLCCHIGSYGEWLIFLFYFFIDERCILMLTLNKSTKYKIKLQLQKSLKALEETYVSLTLFFF